jgi:hypothetical protein
MTRYARYLPLLLCVPGCVHVEPQAGRPEALAPILGGRGTAAVPRSKPSEHVEDLWVPVTPLAPAWPRVSSELPALVRALIARGSWSDEHHAVSEEDGVLRVRHRPEVIAQVKRLLDGLRARLLRPLQIQVAFVELNQAALGPVAAAGFDLRAVRGASAAGKARVLSQAVLGAYSGQWAQNEKVHNQSYLAGFTVDGGITPRSVILAAGHTVQAAAWRWGEERAVLAVAGLYTGESGKGPVLKQTLHRELPQRKKGEREWREQQVTLELPVRELLEFQGQLTVSRGRFALAGLLPRDRNRTCAVLARVDWSQPAASAPAVDPLSDKGLVLEVIPVALPTEVRDDGAKSVAIDNRKEIGQSAEVWFRNRAQSTLENQKKATFNFQDESGQLDLSMAAQAYAPPRRASKRFQSRGGERDGGNLPEALERLRQEILQAEWPEGTALEFAANHVFVVHRKEVTEKVRRLIEKTQEWRNRPHLVELAFPALTPAQVDGLQQATLPDAGARLLRRGETTLPEARLFGRAGSWGELFVGEMHAALAEAWAPDRSSPPLWVYWRGTRLGVRPEPASDGTARLELRFRQHRLERLGVETVADALVQQPLDGIWSLDQKLEIPSGSAALAGVGGGGARLQALLVSVR